MITPDTDPNFTLTDIVGGGSTRMYAKKFYAAWADMDLNAHMRNTAYLEKAADIRQMFLTEHGFPIEEFLRLRIGPVVMKDEVEYFKEVKLQEEITVTCALAGHAPDGSRYLLRHEIFKRDGRPSAKIPARVVGWTWPSASSSRPRHRCFLP
jgi:acyl-CoA thioester hydrolase